MINSSIIRQAAQHIFIATTGFAALLHSTWSVSTLFNGHEPSAIGWGWLVWVIPGFAFAFSIDVGQIAVSIDLRNGERTRWKYITFVALAATTYYFQWYFMVAHVPLVDIAPGVAPEFIGATNFVRAISIWLVPALLPLATTLYTFSYAKPKIVRSTKAANAPAIAANDKAIVPALRPASDLTIEKPPEFPARCDVCGWEDLYSTKRGASNALVAHNRHHHSSVLSSNGRH